MDEQESEAGSQSVQSTATNSAGYLFESWIPATVPIDLVLHRSEDAAVWLSRFAVTPSSLAFELHGRCRGNPRSVLDNVEIQDREDYPPLSGAESDVQDVDEIWTVRPEAVPISAPEPPNGLVVGLIAGNRRASYSTLGGGTSDGLHLGCRGMSAGGGLHHADLACEFVPDVDLTFWIEWADVGVPRTEATVAADVMAESASRAIRLWEDHDPEGQVQVVIY